MMGRKHPRPDVQEIIRVGDQFYVLAASSLADDRTRVLKHSDTLGVFDRYGDVQPVGLGEQGLYHDGTRFLSRYEFLLNNTRPLLLASSVDADNLVLTVDLMNPDLSRGEEIIVPRGTIHLRRARILGDGVAYDRMRVRNFGSQPCALDIVLRFDADFADMFEVRGVRRESSGVVHSPQHAEDGLRIEYEGLDRVRRAVRICSNPAPERIHERDLCFAAQLEGRSQLDIELRVDCDVSTRPAQRCGSFEICLDRARGAMQSLRERACEVRTSNEQFNEWLAASRADLYLMITDTPHGPYPYAGIPWFSTVFGRDGLITALQTLWFDPQVARGVLAYLAATQADASSATLDAEPGKILHEARTGEMAATGEVPYARYYGSVDSTPLFVLLAGEYFRCTNDLEFCERLWPHVQRALDWIDRYGDLDGDGFVEYAARSEGGLTNQGWKDSRDSVFHEDGTLAAGAIALCEVQGYVHAARRRAAELARALRRNELAEQLERQADELRRRFDAAFWNEDEGAYALALDGRKRPCRVLSSNAGQCLFTEIATPEHAHRICDTLMEQRMFSGWGVRTLAADQTRYNPMSYHNGSIWPHDNALIALGAARYGRRDVTVRLLSAMMELSTQVESRRLPELFCGFERVPACGPILYPVACSPQAWAAGSVFLLLQACLGLEIRADRGEVQLREPILPEIIEHVRLRNLRVGNGTMDFDLRREGDDVSVSVPRRAPGIRVITTR